MATLDCILAGLDCLASLATVASVAYFATTTRKAPPCDTIPQTDLDGADIRLTRLESNGMRNIGREDLRAA